VFLKPETDNGQDSGLPSLRLGFKSRRPHLFNLFSDSMIRHIHLINWRSHENTKLEFGYGTNLLVGIMGSGKTSVLDGIIFALFGTFPQLERRQMKLDDIPRYGAPYAKVILSFSWNGSEYVIERKIEKKGSRVLSRAELYKDGTLLENGPTAITKMVEEILGVDYDLFTRAIYSEQNNIDYFLSLEPKRRKEEFDRLLGLDRFEKARATAVTLTNRIESSAKLALEQYSPEKEAELQKSIAEISKKENEIEKGIRENEKMLETAREQLKTLSQSFETIEKNKKQKELLEREIATINGKLASLEEGLTVVDEREYEEKKQALEKTKSELERLRAAKREAQKVESDLKAKMLLVENKIKDAQKKAADIEKIESIIKNLLGGKTEEQIRAEFENGRKELETKNSERMTNLQTITKNRELIKHLAAGMNRCPLCETELGLEGMERVRKKKEEEIKAAEQRIAQIDRELLELKSRIAASEELLKKAELGKQKVAYIKQQLPEVKVLETEKKEAENLLKAAVEKTKKMEQEEKELERQIEPMIVKIKAMEENIRKMKAIAETKKRLAVLTEQHGRISFDESEYLSLKKSLEEKRIEEQKLVAQIQYSKKEYELIGQNKKAYEQELADLLHFKKKAEAMKTIVEELKIYKNALLETQVGLRKELIDAINNAMNEIWGIFYPYGNYKALRVNVTEKDYVFEFLENDEWKPLETIASGGERACAALTLRVALAMVLTPNLSWLIMDEPTHNLDRQAIALLSETLQTRVPQVVKQTFVITHEEGLIGADFSRTYKFDRDKGSMSPTKVEIV